MVGSRHPRQSERVMRVGVSSLHLIGKSFNSLLEAIRTYDVDLWEIVDDDTLTLTDERARQLLGIKRSLDIDYTMHAPFADINIAAVNENFRKMAIDRLKRSLEYARIIEAQLWVFHPGIRSGLGLFYPERDMENCILSVKELSSIADKIEIPIVIENMPASAMFLLRETMDFERFRNVVGEITPPMVLDIGHSNTTNETEGFLEKQGRHIVHIHAHDNSGEVDSHNGIGDGTVPWRVVASKLDNLEFNGSVIVESVKDVRESIRDARQLFL